jgi:hypothetical protein
MYTATPLFLSPFWPTNIYCLRKLLFASLICSRVNEAESTTRIRDLSCMPPTVTRITGGVLARLLQLLATSAITIGHPARIPQAPLYGYDPAAEPVKAISPSLTAWIRRLLVQDHAVLLPAPGPFSYFLHFISHLSKTWLLSERSLLLFCVPLHQLRTRGL